MGCSWKDNCKRTSTDFYSMPPQEQKEEEEQKLQDSKLGKIEDEEDHVVLVERTATYAYHVNVVQHITRSACYACRMDMVASMLLALIILMVTPHILLTAIGAHHKWGVLITQAD